MRKSIGDVGTLQIGVNACLRLKGLAKDLKTCSGILQPYQSGIDRQCDPKFDYVYLGRVTSVIFGPAIFDIPTYVHFYNFHNKLVSAQRNTQSIQILYCALYPQTSRQLE